MTKKLHIKTWGCQMNVYDSERMADALAPMGYQMVDEAQGADMVILNTCHIREKASEKLYSELGRMRPLKQQMADAGEKMIIAVGGCVAQAEGVEIINRAKYVDMVFGPQTYHTLPEMVAQVEKSQGIARLVNTEFPTEAKFDLLPEVRHVNGISAFLSIQEGCDKFCTFCVVPYTRGAEYSRDGASIIAEAQRLVASGIREISLLGQNVNAWHGTAPDGTTWSLGRLILALAELDGLERIRYMTSHPRDMHDSLYEAHAKVPQLMPYLHLPIQSGSDKILGAMNRKHSQDDYRRIIDRLRDLRPDIAFSSDFIVGFPGESDKDFAATMEIIDYVKYASAYSFKYSIRPGTPAAKNIRQIDEKIKEERLAVLQNRMRDHQLAFNQQMAGQIMPVLFDRIGKIDGQLHGRSPWMQSVHVMGPAHLMNQIVDVRVTAGRPSSLEAALVADQTLQNAA